MAYAGGRPVCQVLTDLVSLKRMQYSIPAYFFSNSLADTYTRWIFPKIDTARSTGLC